VPALLSGGWISDNFGRKKSLVILLSGAAIGFFAMSQITGEWPIGLAVAVIMAGSFFLGSAAGCVFALVPLIRRRLTGQIAGMVGAYGIAFAAFLALFLDEPKGAMAEILPDGTVQMIEVH